MVEWAWLKLCLVVGGGGGVSVGAGGPRIEWFAIRRFTEEDRTAFLEGGGLKGLIGLVYIGMMG